MAEQTLGVSEAFNLEIDQPYAPGNYLYYSGGIDDLWLGMWGIFRAYGEPNERLLPLCSVRPMPALPTQPPTGATVRRFEVAAIQCGRKPPIPLILCANAGDWIEVILHNCLTWPVPYRDYPSVPLDLPHIPSNRVSLSPKFLRWDPVSCVTTAATASSVRSS